MNEQPGFKKATQAPFGEADGAAVSISEAFHQVKDAASSVCDAIGSVGASSAGSARATFEKSKKRALELENKAEETMKSRPFVTVGVAFAAGWLVARLMQSSSSQ